MTLAGFGPSPNCQRYSGNFWAAHSRSLQQMHRHNELSLAFDPFWPLLPRTLQQDKQSCPEQYLANKHFCSRKPGRAFCAEAYCWTHCFRLPWAGEAKGASYKAPLIYRPRTWVHMSAVRDAEASPCFQQLWLTNSERRLCKTSSKQQLSLLL